MNRLITVLLLLLARLSLASAAEANDATGGYTTIQQGLGSPVARVGFFDVYGPDFSMTGQFAIDPSMNDFDSAAPGMPFHFSFTQATPGCGATSSPLLVSLTVQGVLWGGSGSCATLTATGQTNGPGYFSGTFSLDSSFEGGNFPFAVSGGGSFLIYITPGTSYVTRADLTFQPSAVPEPSTMSLLLVAFAGLAIAGGRRAFRARWFPAGSRVFATSPQRLIARVARAFSRRPRASVSSGVCVLEIQHRAGRGPNRAWQVPAHPPVDPGHQRDRSGYSLVGGKVVVPATLSTLSDKQGKPAAHLPNRPPCLTACLQETRYDATQS
jgi:hypothetical protein